MAVNSAIRLRFLSFDLHSFDRLPVENWACETSQINKSSPILRINLHVIVRKIAGQHFLYGLPPA